jgi:hypothetical protein
LAKRRLSLKVVVIVAAVLCLSFSCSGSNTAVGIVDNKAVTGVKDNMGYTILMNAFSDGEAWIALDDQDYEEYFSGHGNAAVSEALEAEMKEEYSAINYFVNLEIAPGEWGTQPYRATREIFNSMEVGTKVRVSLVGVGRLA